jgi:hypothetical protein
MRHHRLALPMVLGLVFWGFSSTSARAAYTWSITSPTSGFSANPGGSVAVGGSVGWTFGWDDAVYYVKITYSDNNGNQSSWWATCSVGFQSTTFTGTVQVPDNAQPTGPNGASILTAGYDSDQNSLNTWAQVTGQIVDPMPPPGP